MWRLQMARDYRKEYDDYHGKPEQRKRRGNRNKARRDKGLAVGDKREVHHKDMNPNNNKPSNLAITSRTANRKKQPKRS